MPDREGNQSITCECRDHKRTSLCIHAELLHQFHRIMPPPMVKGEDPDCFFITVERGSLYFSVATKSGSATRQSSKRTVVELTVHKFWRCRSCKQQPNCPHVVAARMEAHALNIIDGDNNHIMATANRMMSARMIRDIRSISYLPIAPPRWLELPGDELQSIPFKGGIHVPDVLRSADTIRCSCGSHEPGVDPITSEITIFTLTTAMKRGIETTYCTSCRNTRGRVGPDLGEFGLFNWNNKVAFTHELMNRYTTEFTGSPTPFVAFHRSTVHTYLSEVSPEPFASLHLFISAWFGFIRLQQLQTTMQCSRCGPNPSTVIADRVSISFPKARVAGLCPPTRRNRSAAKVRVSRQRRSCQTCYSAPWRTRHQFQKALETNFPQCLVPLRAAMDEHRVLTVFQLSLTVI
jgi:CxC4 like cysteine cluster associated with KDZ transposases